MSGASAAVRNGVGRTECRHVMEGEMQSAQKMIRDVALALEDK